MINYAIGAKLTLEQIDALALAARDNPQALALLAEKVAAIGQQERAVELAQQALALAPQDKSIRSIAQPLVADSVPRWHFNIIKDEQRNSAFAAAISCAVTPGSRVLDIGSGTALLAMMAARLGAPQIVSCELNPVVAQAAKEIVATNGLSSTVQIIAKHSMDIDPDLDLGGRVDIIVSEIVSNDFVCEGVLPALSDAARRLLKPDGTMIPRGGSVIVALAYWDRLKDTMMGDVCGFNMTPFNRLRPAKFKVDVNDAKLDLRSVASPLFKFDFLDKRRADASAEIELVADGNSINGIAQWISLELDDQGLLENRPGAGAKSSWACQFFALETEIRPEPGSKIIVRGAQTTNNLRIWIDENT